MILPALLAAALAAAAPPASPPLEPRAEARAIVADLVSCGTRHSLSSWTDPKRGIGCGRDKVVRRFEEISRQTGGKLRVVVDRYETGSARTRDAKVLQRETTEARWTVLRTVAAPGKTVLEGVGTDNEFFAVRSVGKNGHRSIAVPVAPAPRPRG